jgi:predicted nucleotidyltransferase component of viral defense system
VWNPNRSTLDLDFSVDMSLQESRKLVEERISGVTFGVHSVRRQPPGEGRTFVTYAVRVGSSLPDDGRNRTLLEAGRPSTLVIPVEISINEPIGAHNSFALSGGRPLRVSTLEDIVAEKLRAYL